MRKENSLKFFMMMALVCFIGCANKQAVVKTNRVHHEYYDNGQVKLEMHYDNGMLHGTTTEYYEDGTLKNVWDYQDGKLNGITRKYRDTGILESATKYKDDKISGMHNTYYPDGSLWTKEYHENGKILYRKQFDKEGQLFAFEKF